MSILDIVIGILLLIGIFRGMMRGLIVEFASLVGIVVGIYCAINFSYYIGDFLETRVDWDEKYVHLVAFSLTFIIVLILMSFIAKLLTKVAEMAMLGLLNGILGAVFGGLKIAIVIGAILSFMEVTGNSYGLIKQEDEEHSVLYEPIKKIGSTVFSIVAQKVDEHQKEENKTHDNEKGVAI
ncbi:CvpA family protein [Zhouia sp. PK063]|uniref:CvpA family protein n=1 Tax=Zhouia sp. PK063 TaxID=3373602 RepID=UPI00378C5074